MKTIKTIYDSKKNSFALLEFLLAILIIYFHAYPLYYGPSTTNSDLFSRYFSVQLGNVVVAMFFVISGFFIIDSLNRSKSIGEYLKKRIKKIYPPLIFFLLVFSLIIGPLVADPGGTKYLLHTSNYMNYITSNLLFFQNNSYSIVGIFEKLPYPLAISGSLWTIKHTIYTYLCIIPINKYIIKDKKNNYGFCIFYLILFIIALISEFGILDKFYGTVATWNPNLSLFIEFKSFVKLLYFFCSGILINLFKDKIKVNLFTVSIFIIIFILGTVFKKNTYLIYLFIPYLTILLGSIKLPFSIKPYSYHIYIWGFAVQQLIIFYKPNILLLNYIVLGVVISIIFGLVSYYCTENIIYNWRKK